MQHSILHQGTPVRPPAEQLPQVVSAVSDKTHTASEIRLLHPRWRKDAGAGLGLSQQCVNATSGCQAVTSKCSKCGPCFCVQSSKVSAARVWYRPPVSCLTQHKKLQENGVSHDTLIANRIRDDENHEEPKRQNFQAPSRAPRR